MSPADDYNGWAKILAKDSKWGAYTGGFEIGRAAVKQAVTILKGAPTTRSVILPMLYLEPADAAKLYQPSRPDDWYTNDLPADFLPQ